jgi:PAS domain S-box-containing protein
MNARTRRFTRVSGRAEAILGYPTARWRDSPGFWIGVLHPDDRERVAHAVWGALRQRLPCEIEYRAIAADGSVVLIRDRVRVITDELGDLCLQGTITDLTARTDARPAAHRPPRRWPRSRYSAAAGPMVVPARSIGADPEPPPRTPARAPVSRTPAAEPPAPAAEPAIPTAPGPTRPVAPDALAPTAPPGLPARVPAPEPAAEAAELAAFAPDRLLSRLGEAVVASDSEHRIVYWNAAAEALLGVAADQAIGRPDSDLLRTRTSVGQTAEILAGLLGGRPWSAEVSIAGADGTQIPVRITATALRDRGVIQGYVAVVTDLREVRRGEAVRGAAAAMDAVARLAHGVAVELADGVARVEAAVRHALGRIAPADPSRTGMDEALRSVDETAALASQLLAVGRGLKPEQRRTDLPDVVRRGLPAISLLAGDSIEIVTELSPDAPAALVDPTMASQMLLNLAVDAVAAMPEGGRLTIATAVMEVTRNGVPGAAAAVGAGQWVVLEVRDTRSVVPVAIEKLFEPFAEDVSPRGLGLAAAHGLAVANHGHLTATLGPSGGVIFRLLLLPAGRPRT